MSELTDLYREVILDHNKRPRNYQRLTDANRTAEGFNPLCGDQIQLYVKVEDGVIRDIAFQGSGCAISKASASLMTSIVKGKTCSEAGDLFERFRRLLTSELPAGSADLGKLSVFSGVREFPSRVKCASLAWHTLRAALEKQATPVTTE
jgi:nitrogen fixation NifU-like protein